MLHVGLDLSRRRAATGPVRVSRRRSAGESGTATRLRFRLIAMAGR